MAPENCAIAAYASYRPLEWQIEDGAGKAAQGKVENAKRRVRSIQRYSRVLPDKTRSVSGYLHSARYAIAAKPAW